MISIDVVQIVSDITIRCLIIHHLHLFSLSFRLVELHQILNIFLAPEENRTAFVNLSGLNVKDPLGSRRSKTPGLCGYVSDTLTSFTPLEAHTCSVR